MVLTYVAKGFAWGNEFPKTLECSDLQETRNHLDDGGGEISSVRSM